MYQRKISDEEISQVKLGQPPKPYAQMTEAERRRRKVVLQRKRRVDLANFRKETGTR